MDAQEMHRTPRDGRFLDTVALGSMLVFASVMPPLGSDEADAASVGDLDGDDARAMEEPSARSADRCCCT